MRFPECPWKSPSRPRRRASSFPCTQAHARQQPQLFARKLRMQRLRRELDEDFMQAAAGGLDHFSIVVVADAQAHRHLETERPAIDRKRDADLRIRPAALGRLDACHLDREFAHQFIRADDRNDATRLAPPHADAGRAEMHPGSALEWVARAESAWQENELKRDDFSSPRYHAVDYRSSLVFFQKPVSGSCIKSPYLHPAWQVLPTASAAPRPPWPRGCGAGPRRGLPPAGGRG